MKAFANVTFAKFNFKVTYNRILVRLSFSV